jgi:aminoglycoside phosphotransferase family enzyme
MRSPPNALELANKVAFLEQPESYAEGPKAVEALETHLAWVFLTDQHAYKLKKPVRYPFLDFTTVAARRQDALEEVRLNQRLAPGVYLGVVSLTIDDEGQLGLDGPGTAVDWLVKMRRLPRTRTLDHAIAAGTVQDADLRGVVELLVTFYRGAPPIPLAPSAYHLRFQAEIDADEHALAEPQYGLPRDVVARTAAAQRAFLEQEVNVLDARASGNRIVEGHGDLRPEHVCLGPPPVIIDCVEFNREFRILDPADELAYLAMECERLGAPWVGTTLLAYYATLSDDRPPARLLHFYQSVRAALRAKLAAWHLDDATVRYPSQWYNRAQAYLALADRHVREARAQGASRSTIEPPS